MLDPCGTGAFVAVDNDGREFFSGGIQILLAHKRTQSMKNLEAEHLTRVPPSLKTCFSSLFAVRCYIGLRLAADCSVGQIRGSTKAAASSPPRRAISRTNVPLTN